MRVDSQPAFILHHYPYRDNSQILELLSRDHGRISVVSRGSLAAHSKLKSVLQPFRLLQLGWAGRGDMPSLTSAEPALQKPWLLTGSKLVSGFYMNELLLHFLHRHDVQEDIFNLYAATLQQLAEQDDIEYLLRLFEKHLLGHLGLGLNLEHDADTGQPVEADECYVFVVEHGPVRLSVESVVQRPVVQGASLLEFARDELQAEAARREIKQLMRHVLAFYLAGKPLKSRDLFRR